MNVNQTDLSGVYAMLEEIKTDLKHNAQRPVATIDVEAVNNLTATMRQAMEEARQPLTVQKHIILKFAGSHHFIMIVALLVVVIVTFIVIAVQKNELSKRIDNDLKYRYIEMRGEAAPEDILMLREVFDYQRNADSIRTIRKRVERYERLIKEQAESEARVRLNNEKAEQLKQEAEKLR